MADLRERGQIILIAAFALAVTFIALALIVNSAIFTENLASRGEVTGSSEALDTRYMVEQGVGETLDTANLNETTASHSAVADDVQSSSENVSAQMERQQVGSGVLVDVEYISNTPGKVVIQEDPSQLTFEDSSGNANYELVGSVERVADGNGTRAFHINASNLATTNSSALEVKVGNSLDDNENSWRMRVWNSTGNETIHVRTHRNISGTNTVEECQVDVDSPSTRIDVTRGYVDGQPCDALRRAPNGDDYRFGTGAGSTYNIYFKNADSTRGNFSLIIHDSSLDLASLVSLGSGQPYETDGLYDVTVEFTYDRADFHYETRIRVAPGEPDA